MQPNIRLLIVWPNWGSEFDMPGLEIGSLKKKIHKQQEQTMSTGHFFVFHLKKTKQKQPTPQKIDSLKKQRDSFIGNHKFVSLMKGTHLNESNRLPWERNRFHM